MNKPLPPEDFSPEIGTGVTTPNDLVNDGVTGHIPGVTAADDPYRVVVPHDEALIGHRDELRLGLQEVEGLGVRVPDALKIKVDDDFN